MLTVEQQKEWDRINKAVNTELDLLRERVKTVEPVKDLEVDLGLEYVRAGVWAPLGWMKVVTLGVLRLKEVDPKARIAQIKEKFGSLRFYLESGSSSEAYIVAQAVEDLANDFCQNCGNKFKDHVDIHEKEWGKLVCSNCKDG